MRAPPAPFRFLLLIVGSWVGVRAATMSPADVQTAPIATETAPTAPAAPAVPAQGEPAAVRETAFLDAGFPLSKPNETMTPYKVILPVQPARPPETFRARYFPLSPSARGSRAHTARPLYASVVAPALTLVPIAAERAHPSPLFNPAPAASPVFAAAQAPSSSRWTGSAWLFVREELGGGNLAPGGTLGGSQTGARLTYRVNKDSRRPLSLSARLYTPLDNVNAAEAALGIDWRPIAALPINLLAERRQAIGADGRSDFALMLHGGAERRIANGRVRIEGYGQAGIVGVNDRDLFADGAITATARLGPVDLGVGAWGGAQPGVSRVDVGPHVSLRQAIGHITLRASAEWRFRALGNAAPNSGPSLTISAGF